MGQNFPSTQWSRLLALGQQPSALRASALDHLATRYWRPVHDYVCALRGPDEARDITQQFFERLLTGERLAHLSPDKGSFRGFLKTSLRHFLINAGLSESIRSRKVMLAGNEAMLELADDAPSPEQAFDRAWAKDVLDASIQRLRAELEGKGRSLQLQLFESYYLDEAGLTHDELSARFGLTLDQVNHHLREGRARLRQHVRRLLRDHVATGDDLEAELKLILAGP